MQGLALNSPKMRELFLKNGVDINQPRETPEEREARIKRDEAKMQQSFRAQKAKVFYSYSLWPNGRPLRFEFKRWNPSLQADAKLAREVGERAWQIAKEMVNDNKSVMMVGKPGTGKTSLGLAMVDYLSKQGKSVMVVSTSALADLYKVQYEMADVKGKIANILRAMKEVDVLMLDDFGTEGGLRTRIKEPGYRGVHSDMQTGMYAVANARYDLDSNRRTGSVIITTNNPADELARMYDTKILSRLIPTNPKYQLSFMGLRDVRR